MGAQPGDMLDDGTFTLINHWEENLTNEESVEQIANHFARISQEFPPINVDNLPQSVQIKISSELDEMNVPVVDEMQVYQHPFQKCTVFRTGKWPSSWKIEHRIPLQKKSKPKDEDDLRIISLTAFYSKVLEKIIMEWLLEYMGPHIDWGHYGGQQGTCFL